MPGSSPLVCKHPEDGQFCSGEGDIWPWRSPVPKEVHGEFATGFLGMESAPTLGLRGCSWWSLETDLCLKPPCPVMSPVKGLLAQNVQLVPPWHDPHTPWVSHGGALSSLYTTCLSSDQVTPGGQKRGCRGFKPSVCSPEELQAHLEVVTRAWCCSVLPHLPQACGHNGE